ncbi:MULTISPECIES: catechol 2,3-dioxygenase [Janibacter]|uniref:Metapyrocatechase n=1 Tax=Janibacter indicus TaxID=857417 RepID=A0A1W2ASB3_9MICO|nr:MULTISPECIES: catechol 2,3-dioxygenase [Janibacter]QNF94281.1 catechol 2,3-dioxygenase [Janibacter sp. YB324]SMC63629.1 catechol 2,3-dioxygenase [Janibacter indicus]
MGIMRMGYAHVRVTDMTEAKNHYASTMGLYETLEDTSPEGNKRVFYKGWDEWDHHSVVLEEGGVGVVKYGWKVEHEADIDDVEAKARTFGLTVERMSKGDNPEIGDGIRFVTPSEHVFEVYHQATAIGTELGTHNPEVFPRHLVGIGAPALDHSLITTGDVGTMERMLSDVFGFYATERVQTSLEDDHECVGTWMTSNNQIHQLAVIGGPQGKLHHFAFRLEDWNSVGRAADLMTMDDVPIDIGPTRHGITRGQTVYFFDPSGNRNEVFSGGYLAFPDRPTNVWTVDQLGKGIFYHDRELNERFTTVLT